MTLPKRRKSEAAAVAPSSSLADSFARFALLWLGAAPMRTNSGSERSVGPRLSASCRRSDPRRLWRDFVSARDICFRFSSGFASVAQGQEHWRGGTDHCFLLVEELAQHDPRSFGRFVAALAGYRLYLPTPNLEVAGLSVLATKLLSERLRGLGKSRSKDA